MGHVQPSAEQFEALRREHDLAARVTMLNLLRFRDEAHYPEHPGETPCSGREAYARYAKAAGACVHSHGGRVVFSGPIRSTLIGPEDERWDSMLLVEYPSLRAFLEMIESDTYRAIVHHRSAAVEDSRLFPILDGETLD